MNDFFQILIKQFPKMRMAFYQPRNITEIFELICRVLSRLGSAGRRHRKNIRPGPNRALFRQARLWSTSLRNAAAARVFA
jgi:hypothetical protein